MKSLLTAAALMLAATSAQAVTITFGPASSTDAGPLIAFENVATPTAIVGDAVLSFSVVGDLNALSENVSVTLDGLSLGTVFNGNSTDDAFDVAGDIGVQAGTTGAMNVASTVISEAVMAGIIGDGLVSLSFDFSPNVDDFGSVQILSASLTFTDPNNLQVVASNVVPLPASALLLLAGLGGIGAMARRKAK